MLKELSVFVTGSINGKHVLEYRWDWEYEIRAIILLLFNFRTWCGYEIENEYAERRT